MLRLSGRSALTPFRTEQLLAKLAKVAPNVRGVGATYAYFVDVPRVTPALEQKLAELLPLAPDAPQTTGKLVLVVPRIGTLSPWASKATDIARSCGFDDVRCIERGVAYRLEGTLVPEDVGRVRPFLHDRMTETVLERFEDARGSFGARSRGNPSASPCSTTGATPSCARTSSSASRSIRKKSTTSSR